MTDTAQDEGAPLDGGGPARSTGYLLWHVVNLWQRRQKQVLAPFQLTPVQYLLLAGLRDLRAVGDHAVTQTVLARHCRTDPMMTSQVLRVLEKQGFVARRVHDGDGRAVAVAATAAGESLVRRAADAVETAEREFFEALGPDVRAFGDALTLLTGERPRRRVPARRG
ncbi:MAG: MarR family transcriptional regulator [Alphaproteobacteria bacterium]|nr:MarR family transcriptional regulator [Alphaproteobacteria bacterium]